MSFRHPTTWIRLRASALAALALTPLASVSACAAVGGVPPLVESEVGLPGARAEERWMFGLVSREQTADGGTSVVVRPIVQRTTKPGEAQEEARWFVLPPFGYQASTDLARTLTVWPLVFGNSFGSEEDREKGESDDDTLVAPILAWGSEPFEGSYFLFFPVYGTIRGKLFTDKIRVVLFPIFAQVESEGWESMHFLWPLVAVGSGEDRSHFRVLPLWSQTDGPERSSRSLLWPVGHWGTQIRGERRFRSWFVFPLLGREWSEDGATQQLIALYPFFQRSWDTRTGYEQRAVLWPFHQHEVRPGESESTWWWPFYGAFDSATDRSRFYLWPLIWDRDVDSGHVHQRIRYVVPFWMEAERSPADPTVEGGRSREIRSWPLFSFHEEADGRTDLAIPDLIPVFGWRAGEEVYGRLLTLFRRRTDPMGREAVDLPLGIVRWRRDAEGRGKLTLLWWLTFGGGEE